MDKACRWTTIATAIAILGAASCAPDLESAPDRDPILVHPPGSDTTLQEAAPTVATTASPTTSTVPSVSTDPSAHAQANGDGTVQYVLYTTGSLLRESDDSGMRESADEDGCPSPRRDLRRESCVVVRGLGGAFDLTVDVTAKGDARQLRLNRHDDGIVLVERTVVTTSISEAQVVAGRLDDGDGWAALLVTLSETGVQVLEVFGWPEGSNDPHVVAALPRAIGTQMHATPEGLALQHLHYAPDDDFCCPSGQFEGLITRNATGTWIERGTITAF